MIQHSYNNYSIHQQMSSYLEGVGDLDYFTHGGPAPMAGGGGGGGPYVGCTHRGTSSCGGGGGCLGHHAWPCTVRYKEKGDALERDKYRSLKLLEQVMKVVERIVEANQRKGEHWWYAI